VPWVALLLVEALLPMLRVSPSSLRLSRGTSVHPTSPPPSRGRDLRLPPRQHPNPVRRPTALRQGRAYRVRCRKGIPRSALEATHQPVQLLDRPDSAQAHEDLLIDRAENSREFRAFGLSAIWKTEIPNESMLSGCGCSGAPPQSSVRHRPRNSTPAPACLRGPTSGEARLARAKARASGSFTLERAKTAARLILSLLWPESRMSTGRAQGECPTAEKFSSLKITSSSEADSRSIAAVSAEPGDSRAPQR